VNYLAFSSGSALAAEAARRFIAALPGQGEFLVALSGGRIAKSFYQSIVAANHANWRGVHFFFCDERCVPPDDPECNYFIARQHLFEPLGIPADQIHRIRAEVAEEFAVQEAEAELCRLAPMNANGQPILDLAILGMGEDGHTASLFPGEPDSMIKSPAVYRAVTAPKPPPRRITIGYAPLAVARQLWVLASGSGKEKALTDVLAQGTSELPLARVLQSNSNSLILSDIPVSPAR